MAWKELKKAQTVMQLEELKCRKRVLRRLGYANASDVIEMKGRVACEISRYTPVLCEYIVVHVSLSAIVVMSCS